MKTIKGVLTFCLFALGLGAACAQTSLQDNPDSNRLAHEQEVRAQDEAERQKRLLRLEQELVQKQQKEKIDAAVPATPAPVLLAQQSPVAPPRSLTITPATPAAPMTPEQEAAARALLRQAAEQAAPAAPSPGWPQTKELGRGYAPNVRPSSGQGTKTVVIPPSPNTRTIVIPPGATPPPEMAVPPAVVTTPAVSPSPAPIPVVVPPANSTAPAVPITPDSETAARALLRQKMAELNAAAPLAPTATSLPALPPPPVAVVAPVIAPPATPAASMTPEQEAAARDVLRARMTEVFDTPKGAINDADARARAEQEKNLREASRIQVEAEAKRLAEERNQAPPAVLPAAAVPGAAAVTEAQRTAEADRAARMARIEAEMAKRGVQVPAPAPAAAPTLVTPITPAGPLSPEQDVQAREVLRQKMAELSATSASLPQIAPRSVAPPAAIPPAALPPAAAPATALPTPAAGGLSGDQESAAREMLRKKLSELNAVAVPVAATAAPPAPAPAPPPVPVVAPAATAPPIAPAPPAAAAPGGLTPDQEAAARQLLRANYAAAAPVVAPPAVPAPVAAPTTPPPVVTPGSLDPATDAKARELLRQKMNELANAQPAPPAASAVPTRETPPPEVRSAAPAQPGAVAPSYPKTKQQRLSDLLEAYKADKITPADYHNQRAKIIAEP